MRRANVLWATGLAALIAVPVNAVEVKPYGFVLAEYTESIGRGNTMDTPFQAVSGNKNESHQQISNINVRATRFGLNLAGGKGPFDSDASGVIEADFNGLRQTGTATTDSLSFAPRLRLAYMAFKSGIHTVTFGMPALIDELARAEK